MGLGSKLSTICGLDQILIWVQTKCYNYGNKGHFARECIKPKQVCSCFSNSCAYVSSCVMLTESIPLWTVDLAVVDHIARDQRAYVADGFI